MSDAFYAFCAFGRTDGRTDGMSTDYSSLSLRSAAKCAAAITFFFREKRNKTKQKTN
jgi:hypothetical protein